MEAYFMGYNIKLTKEIFDECKEKGTVEVVENNSYGQEVYLSTGRDMFKVLCDDGSFNLVAEEENKNIEDIIKEEFEDVDFTDENTLYLNDRNIEYYEKIKI